MTWAGRRRRRRSGTALRPGGRTLHQPHSHTSPARPTSARRREVTSRRASGAGCRHWSLHTKWTGDPPRAEPLLRETLHSLRDPGLEVMDFHPSRGDVDPCHHVVERVNAGFPFRELLSRRQLHGGGEVLRETPPTVETFTVPRAPAVHSAARQVGWCLSSAPPPGWPEERPPSRSRRPCRSQA